MMFDFFFNSVTLGFMEIYYFFNPCNVLTYKLILLIIN